MIAKYRIYSKVIEKAADAIAIGQSIGNPDKRANYETDKIWDTFGAKVVDIQTSNNNEALVTINYPNNIFTKGSLTHLLTVLMGGQMDIDIIEKCVLEEVKFDLEIVKPYLGPKYGVDKIRDSVGVLDRPMIGGIIKPKTGLDEDILKIIVSEMIDGGIDFIKEDEILGEIPGLKFLKRIQIIDELIEKKNSRVIYAPALNVAMCDLDHSIKELNKMNSIKAFHFNVWGGLDLFKYISDNSNKMAFYQKSGDKVITSGKFSISFEIWCVLCRLAGADMIHAGMVGGYLDEPIELMTQRIKNIQGEFFSLKGTIPSMSCGAHPGLVKYLHKNFGNNIMISSGGAIHAHRDGTFSGTKAFLDAANELKSKELDVAIEQFGLKE